MSIARHSNHLPKPTECLRRVFVPIVHFHLLPPSQTNHQQTRLVSLYTFKPNSKFIKPSHRPRDESITSRLVQLVLEGSNQRLAPEPPSQILARIDRTKFFLVQVSGPEAPISICKIISKLEEREREKQKLSSPKDQASKELEFHWNIGPHDLKRKMDWLKEFLEEGRRVDIRIKRRRRWENPSTQEVGLLEGTIQGVAEGVIGTKEYKPRQEQKAWAGEKGNMHYYFKGPARKRENSAQSGEKGSRRLERAQEMEEKKEKRKKRAEERKEIVQHALKANV